ncbi:MAG: spermidine synthase, partial [Steroidobacter sp.]
LRAYWSARNQFLAAGRNVHPNSDVREMLAQVRDPLLSVLHISPDFRPAYDPLLRMAAALSQVDRHAARSLLGELQQTQPRRPEASELLREIPAD